MQTIPNPAELTLHVRLKPEGVQAGYARRRKRRDHAKAATLRYFGRPGVLTRRAVVLYAVATLDGEQGQALVAV